MNAKVAYKDAVTQKIKLTLLPDDRDKALPIRLEWTKLGCSAEQVDTVAGLGNSIILLFCSVSFQIRLKVAVRYCQSVRAKPRPVGKRGVSKITFI